MAKSTDTLPRVRVWRKDSTVTTGSWIDTAGINQYDSLTWTPTFNDIGSWAISIPWGTQAQALYDNIGGLVTIDWRDYRSTWGMVEPKLTWDTDRNLFIFSVSGVAALSRLGREQAWADPTKAINAQPIYGPNAPAPYSGPAETVIKAIVSGNSKRAGMGIVVPASAGLGSTVSARPQREKMLELVQGLAATGGVGIALDLVDTTPGRADLTLRVWEPVDRTQTALLTAAAGSLAEYEQSETEPTLTRAMVKSAGGVVTPITTPESEAAAARWGGHYVEDVDGPDSFDPAEIRQAGEEAIAQGGPTQHLSVETADVKGVQAFTHYQPGDILPSNITGAVPIVAPISSITGTVNVDPGTDEPLVTVDATIGDPDIDDPDVRLGETVRQMGRAVRRLQRKV